MNLQDEKFWTEKELSYLKNNFESQTYEELSKNIKRSENGVRHQCSNLKLYRRKDKAKVGDIIKGWKIVEIYTENNGKQDITYAKVESTINDKVGKYRLTQLTQEKIGWPDRRRPDITNNPNNHNLCNTRLYSIWNGMKTRCLNKNQAGYKNYGARGIKICDEWLTFMNFYNWAITNGYKQHLTLDRIDNDGNYCPSNCRWATRLEQSRNKQNSVNITAWKETKTVIEWAEDERCTMPYDVVLYRINHGWDAETAMTSPNCQKDTKMYYFCKTHHPNIIEEFLNT